jgi:collagenase-like PrtC family protease
VDAVIAADISVLDYARRQHPELPLHLSVQGSATNYEAIRFYHEQFGIRRVVLPRVLSLSRKSGMCWRTARSLSKCSASAGCASWSRAVACCRPTSPANRPTCAGSAPRPSGALGRNPTGLETRLGGLLIDRYAPGEPAGYPTLCKGRFIVGEQTYYAIEEPTSLNTLELLPELQDMGIAAIKIEGRQRSPAYVTQVTKVWRAAIDACRRNPTLTPETGMVARNWARSRKVTKPRWALIIGPGNEGGNHD